MSQSDAGKGYLQRPIQNQQAWDQSYERTFGMLRFDWPKCNECKQPFIFEEDEPFAYCDCGITEWGEAGRPGNWKRCQRQHLRETRVIIDNDPAGENDSKT